MPIIARALTGDPAGLARPQTAPPWDDDDAELIVDAADDEQGFHKLTERLLDEFEQWAKATYPADGPVWRNGTSSPPRVLEWKGAYGDGCLGRWTSHDLAEFLLDYFPRKVSVHEDTLEDVVDCVIALLRFLDHPPRASRANPSTCSNKPAMRYVTTSARITPTPRCGASRSRW